MMPDLACTACGHPKSLHFSVDGCHGVFRALRCECQEFTVDTKLWNTRDLLSLKEQLELELASREDVS